MDGISCYASCTDLFQQSKLLLEQRKVVLILDNATYYPKSIIDSFSQVKIIFLPKNTTERDFLSMYLLELMNSFPQWKLLKM